MEIFKLFGSIFVDTEEANKSISKTDANAKTLGEKFIEGGKTAAKWGAAIASGAAIAGGAMIAFVSNVTDATAEITKFAQVNGMTTDEFQRWDYVMKSFGYSAEQASGDIAALGEKAMDAANGVGEGAELFGMLGVRVTEAGGKLKSQEQIFNEVIYKLQSMNDITRRNAIASALLSTTGEELVPVLNMTNKELEAMKNNANVISSEDLKKAEDFRKTFNGIKSEFNTLFQTIAIDLAPILTSLFDSIEENMPEMRERTVKAIQTILPFVELFANILGFVAANLNVILPIILAIGAAIAALKIMSFVQDTTKKFKEMDSQMQRSTIIILGIVAALTALAAIIAIIMGRGNELKTTFNDIGQGVQGITTGATRGTNYPRYATGTDYHRGGLAIVGEEGPELLNIPVGSKVYTKRETEEMLSNNNYNGNNAQFSEMMNRFDKMISTFEGMKQAYQDNRRFERMGRVEA